MDDVGDDGIGGGGVLRVTVVVNDRPVAVILHPPAGARKSWYAYWPGLVASKSTGQQRLEAAVVAAERMVRNGGKRVTAQDAGLTDEECEQIQRGHFAKKTDPAARSRAEKTLEECLDAVAAFREITGLKPVTLATPADCERFQKQALALPKNWRRHHPKGRKDAQALSPNTVLKWSRMLQAAFDRANRNAGRKCVRGVVGEGKLLTSNPWTQFRWIEGRARPLRHFYSDEFVSLLSFLETEWADVPAGAAAAKVFLWSSCRKLEVAALTWDDARTIGDEYHFEVVGKWGVERWFRVPEALYRELLALRAGSRFVFAAYNEQIRRAHADRPGTFKKITPDFRPKNFGRWFYERVVEWSRAHAKGHTFVHTLRKTTLQHARRGEDINRQVAGDARVSEAVLMTGYVKETDEELRQKSSRTYRRIMAGLTPQVARGYGHVEGGSAALEEQVQVAVAARNWTLAATLTAKLAKARTPEVG